MHATHKFTDWLRSARSASRMAVFLSFSAWQTYQPSSGGAPSACAHLKYTHTHTCLLLTQEDACSRNKLNQMSALQISFLIPLSPPLWPLLLFFLIAGSPTREWYRTTSNSPSSLHRFILPSPRLRWNPSDDVPRRAEPTLPSGADGWATEAGQANKRVWHHVRA